MTDDDPGEEPGTTRSEAPTGSDLGFGIDIGGSGMKAATVDLRTGRLASDRYRIPTPRPATPAAMAGVVKELVEHHAWSRPLGVCFPAVVVGGVVVSAANIDKGWIGVDAGALFSDVSRQPVTLLNDADAAGIAEMRWGAGRDRRGVVLCLTFGTGIGSGLFVDGKLVPNTELGHLELDGHDAEARAASSVRKRDELSYKKWAKRVDRYLVHVVKLFSPQLIILGGGASRHAHKWVPRLDPGCEVAVAEMANNAGIAGAAAMGEHVLGTDDRMG